MWFRVLLSCVGIVCGTAAGDTLARCALEGCGALEVFLGVVALVLNATALPILWYPVKGAPDDDVPHRQFDPTPRLVRVPRQAVHPPTGGEQARTAEVLARSYDRAMADYARSPRVEPDAERNGTTVAVGLHV
jgi:hypothetical protein